MECFEGEDEFYALLSRIRDGDGCEEDLRLLSKSVSSSEPKRTLYFEFMAAEAKLSTLVNSNQEDGSGANYHSKLVDFQQVFGDQDSTDSSSGPPQIERSSQLSTLIHLGESVSWGSHPVRFISFALLLTLGCWGILGIFLDYSWRRPSIVSTEKNSNPSAIVAYITAKQNAVWDKESFQPSSGNFPITSGTLLKLREGLVRLTFQSGTIVNLQGPVSFKLIDENSAALLSGLLVADVADGFQLRTPQVSIVDLGTQFGVKVTKSGSMDIAVFKGSVLVRPLFDKTQSDLTLIAGGFLSISSKLQTGAFSKWDVSRKAHQMIAKLQSPSFMNIDVSQISNKRIDVLPANTGQGFGINFSDNEDDQFPENIVAGIVPQKNWNHTQSGEANGLLESIVDSKNQLLAGLTVQWSSSNTWRQGNALSGNGNINLLKGYLDDWGSGIKVKISGIPYQKYDLYLYGVGDREQGLKLGDYRVSANGNIFHLTWRRGEALKPGRLMILGTSSTKGHCMAVKGLTSSSIRIDAAKAIHARSPLAGLQIVEATQDRSTK